ncbi:MAG: OmpA family protein [bacterium]
MLFFGVVALVSGPHAARAESTIVPLETDPPACQADRKDRTTCKRWYEMVEDPDPTACLYVRRNLETKCGRWYHVGEEAPRPVKVEAKKIVIDQMVHFDFNKYNIKKDSYQILDDVASILQKNPQIKRVKVEGNTDSIGSDAYNQKLSQRRAEAVVDYLVNKGISRARLEPVGYGKSRPIATNKTAAGRAQNRRTEFNVVEQ